MTKFSQKYQKKVLTPLSVNASVCFLPQLTLNTLIRISAKVFTTLGTLFGDNNGPIPKQPADDTPMVYRSLFRITAACSKPQLRGRKSGNFLMGDSGIFIGVGFIDFINSKSNLKQISLVARILIHRSMRV